MREYDTEILILQLIDLLAKRAVREKVFEKRRTDARYPLDIALPACRTTRDDEEFTALDLRVYGVDISYHGIGLITTQSMSPSSKLRVSLQPLGLHGISILAQIVYCRRMIDGVYRVGAEFVHQQVQFREGKRIFVSAQPV